MVFAMVSGDMLTIIVPTMNAQDRLPTTLEALVPGAIKGLVKRVIVVDGGSSDKTVAIAEAAGADVVTTGAGRGNQLRAGAERAKTEWLLFLHADTVLADEWLDEVGQFTDQQTANHAAAFRFALDDGRWRARVLESAVWLRCRMFALPYGDQGLLISRSLYDEIGGFKPLVLMEDVDIVQRIGRARLSFLRTRAVTDADRYRKAGYLRRSLKNLSCLAQWFAGVAPEKILKRYQ